MNPSPRKRLGLVTAVLALIALATAAVALPSQAASSESLFGTSKPTVGAVTNDSATVELGVQFKPAVNGTVTGVRFWKGAGNTGTHTGSLWSSAGKQLATGTFAGESASGWQVLAFKAAVAVQAGKTYTASYHAPRGHYADDENGLKAARTSGDLTAPKNGGVFNYSARAAYPTGVWHASNYWVDVQFTPGAVAPPTTTTQPPPTTTTPPVTTTPPTTTTAPSVSTTTSPPPVVTGDWPTAADTGPTGQLSDVIPPTGELIVGDNNQVLQNVRVHGDLTVLGCNVTVRNVEVDGGENLRSPVNDTPDEFIIWDKANEGCVTTIDHVSAINTGQYATEALRSNGSVTQHVTAFEGEGTQLGITLGEADHVSDSYILLAATLRGDHNEDILDDGDEGVQLVHNTFLNPNGQTAALSLFNEFGPNRDFLIEDNWLAGGGYTCYCGDGVDARASNITFSGNVFSRQYFPQVGAFGPGRAYNPAGGGSWTGNVYADQSGTVTTEQVPQPPIDQ